MTQKQVIKAFGLLKTVFLLKKLCGASSTNLQNDSDELINRHQFAGLKSKTNVKKIFFMDSRFQIESPMKRSQFTTGFFNTARRGKERVKVYLRILQGRPKGGKVWLSLLWNSSRRTRIIRSKFINLFFKTARKANKKVQIYYGILQDHRKAE